MTILEELIKLRKAWTEEIISAFEDDIPEENMRRLLETEIKLGKEIDQLELIAKDIIRRYQI